MEKFLELQKRNYNFMNWAAEFEFATAHKKASIREREKKSNKQADND